MTETERAMKRLQGITVVYYDTQGNGRDNPLLSIDELGLGETGYIERNNAGLHYLSPSTLCHRSPEHEFRVPVIRHLWGYEVHLPPEK